MTNRSRNKKKESNNQPAVPEKTEKEQRLFDNLYKSARQYIQGRSFSPLNQEEIFQRLNLPEQHRSLFNDVLAQLVKEKLLVLSHGHYAYRRTSEDIIEGIMRLHPRGFGFVKPSDASLYVQDIFIPKHLTQNAIEGDRVEVLVNNETISEKGPEGRVLSVLSRARSHLAGIIKGMGRNGAYYAHAPMLGAAAHILVQSEDVRLKIGDRIVMEVIEWGNKDEPTICRLSHQIGHISDPSCDISAAIEEFELRRDFPTAAIAEAQAFGTKVSLKEIKGREDFRTQICVTIDPDTAKDFDDAISLTKDSNGNFHLSVHIADVSHYVAPGSALDKEAEERCNSTYFPGTCLPMLPKELSSHLCSLKEGVNRLTISVIASFDPQGELLEYRIVRGVIKSAKRLTYKQAKAILDGKKPSTLLEMLQLMVKFCGILKKLRYERGSIEFALPELIVLVDEAGVPLKTDYIQYDITHQLVEEFMLKANEIVATHLSKQGKEMAYRVHDQPSEENMKDFSLLANAFGFQLPSKCSTKEIQQLFDEAMQSPYGQYLATSYIKRMRLAIYSPENIGHFGLSLTHYCHFTSPIRRYIDLVVHRLLFCDGESKEKLKQVSESCSEQERVSAKAESSVLLLKKLRLLDAMSRGNRFKQYEAVVTRVKNFGIYFEVIELLIDSYLHVSEMHNDYYEFDEKAVLLRGRHTGISFQAGDKICVMLKQIDFITQETIWELVPPPSSELKKVKKAPPFKPIKIPERFKKKPKQQVKKPLPGKKKKQSGKRR